MISVRISRALACRAATGRDAEDGGFAMIFVLFVTLFVTALVAAMFAVVAPNIRNASDDRNSQAALAAAYGGVEDFVAQLSDTCATVARCPLITAGNNTASGPLAGTNESYTWTADTTVTTDGLVRVRVRGTAGGTTRNVVADVLLNRPILDYGYYTDYETQSPDYINQNYGARVIKIADSGIAGDINQYDTNNSQVSASAPTSVSWSAPPYASYSPNVCGQHWYAEPNATPAVPGRASYASGSVWAQAGMISNKTVVKPSSCDVVFTSGMTLDGPVYSRDALYISDGTYGGTGPNFKQPVYTLWGTASTNNPAVDSMPWRRDPNVGGQITSPSQAPTVASGDLKLTQKVDPSTFPKGYCQYSGPTRIVLNPDGTATVISPYTTPLASSDAGCYSSTDGGLTYRVNYQSVGGGVLYVTNNGCADNQIKINNACQTPTAVWPLTGQKATSSPATADTVFLKSVSGGATTPDQTDTSTAPSSACANANKYAATASATCAWTNLATATDTTASAPGWTAYSAAKCSAAVATDRQLFECEYGNLASTATPSVAQAGGSYAALRAAVQADIQNQCLTADVPTRTTCLTGRLNVLLQNANTGKHAVGYATPAVNDHRYVVTSANAGSSNTGTAQTVGTSPAAPYASDSLFTSSSSPAQETPTTTPVTLTVGRQTYNCYNTASPYALYTGGGACSGSRSLRWGDGKNSALTSASTPAIAQFGLTVTGTKWSITTAASGSSYFPDMSDVTQYNVGTGGNTTTNAPGDIYVQGTNMGQLSLVADNDVIITGDLTNKTKNPADSSAGPTDDALDITAGRNVRNYHPVKCADNASADINATDPGWCPNDISGLYRGLLETNGNLTCDHPASQYLNTGAVGATTTCSSGTQNCPSTLPARRIDAALFTLTGSFLTDNFNRGCQLGTLTVNGGLYQSHRGANGIQWEYQQGDAKRARSGYSLQYHYVSLQRSSVPFAPATTGTGGLAGRMWNVVSISNGA